MAKKAMYINGISKMAEDLGYHRTYLYGVIKGARKSKPAAMAIYQYCGIRSRNQGLDYNNIPRNGEVAQ